MLKFKNFTTNKEYQGSNIQKLAGLGSEFCTFKQAIKFYKCTGKLLAGAKKCARLSKVVKVRELNPKTGRYEETTKVKHFNVFERKHLENIMDYNLNDVRGPNLALKGGAYTD